MKRKRCFLLALCISLSLAFVHIGEVHAETAGSDTSSLSNLVLYVQFSDTGENFMTPAYTAKAVKYYTDTDYTKSLVSYIDTVSYGQLHIETYMPQLDQGTITPIVLDSPRSTYSDGSGYAVELAALEKAKQLNVIPSTLDLDLNKDGYIDNVTFIFAGDEGSRGSALYAHEAQYEDPYYKINGKAMGTVNVLMANDILEVNSSSASGVIIHEFMHSLGYPDLYHEESGDPVGSWDIMAQATTFTAWPLAYMRSTVSNWLSIDTITADQKSVTLVPSSQASGNQAYILKTGISDSEFFVVEYRQKGDPYNGDLDAKIPGSGLIIYRINTNTYELSNRASNGIDGVYVFREGETSVTAGTSENLQYSYFSADCGRTSYGSSDLTASIADNAIVYSDGQNSGIVISNISSCSDTMTFDVSFADTSNAGVWESLGGSSVVSSCDTGVMDTAVKTGAQYPTLLLGDDAVETNTNLNLYDYNGTSWQKTSASAITDYGTAAKLAYCDGIPYVLYTDSTNYKPKLVRYKDGAWETIAEGLSQNQTNYLGIGAYAHAVYIAWDDGSDPMNWASHTLVIQKYDSTGMHDVYTSSGGYYLDIQFTFMDESIYVSAVNADTSLSPNPTPTVYQIHGTDVKKQAVPNEAYSDVELYGSDHVLYMLACNKNDDGTTALYQYSTDFSSVTKIGADVPSSKSVSSSLTVVNGVPFVQVVDQSSPKSTKVYRYENAAWVQEGLSAASCLSSNTSMWVNGDVLHVSYMSDYDQGTNVPYVKYKKINISTGEATAPEVNQIIASANKTVYQKGESFQAQDLSVTALYSNMTSTVLSYGSGADQYHLSGFDTSAAGKKTITVQYGSYSDTYEITVNVPALTPTPTSTPTSTSTPKPAATPAATPTPTAPASTPAPVVVNEMYRLYNPNSGEHFYTKNVAERDYLVPLGWRYEGIGWYAPENSSTPVYRLYNPNSGDHHYTVNMAERDWLVTLGWRYEGIGWYSDDKKAVPLYRQYNPNAVTGTHNYTRDKTENDWLVTLGWRAEGIGWYGCRSSN